MKGESCAPTQKRCAARGRTEYLFAWGIWQPFTITTTTNAIPYACLHAGVPPRVLHNAGHKAVGEGVAQRQRPGAFQALELVQLRKERLPGFPLRLCCAIAQVESLRRTSYLQRLPIPLTVRWLPASASTMQTHHAQSSSLHSPCPANRERALQHAGPLQHVTVTSLLTVRLARQGKLRTARKPRSAAAAAPVCSSGFR